MKKEEAKKAFQQAEKELKEKQFNKVKEIVKKSLEKLEKLKEEKFALDKRIKYVRMDLDDLKEGKLDRIEERQQKDPEAKKNSVVIIIKEKEVIREVPYLYDYWYWPYKIYWNYPEPYYTSLPLIAVGNSSTYDMNAIDNCSLTTGNDISINCSVAKDASSGTYEIGDKIIHLR